MHGSVPQLSIARLPSTVQLGEHTRFPGLGERAEIFLLRLEFLLHC